MRPHSELGTFLGIGKTYHYCTLWKSNDLGYHSDGYTDKDPLNEGLSKLQISFWVGEFIIYDMQFLIVTILSSNFFPSDFLVTDNLILKILDKNSLEEFFCMIFPVLLQFWSSCSHSSEFCVKEKNTDSVWGFSLSGSRPKCHRRSDSNDVRDHQFLPDKFSSPQSKLGVCAAVQTGSLWTVSNSSFVSGYNAKYWPGKCKWRCLLWFFFKYQSRGSLTAFDKNYNKVSSTWTVFAAYSAITVGAFRVCVCLICTDLRIHVHIYI